MFTLKHCLKGLALGATLSLIVGCQSSKSVDAYEGYTDTQIFNQAQKHIKKGRIVKATEDLEALEAHYPFGEYADKAQLAIIYTYFEDEQSEAAISAADRFIQIHPRHAHVDYAYYMKGMAYFQEAMGFFDRWFPMEREDRDQNPANKSFAAFSDLIRRYPDSVYAKDAHQRMIYLKSKMAEHELSVARYYMKRKAYLAAANRAQGIIEHFDKTTALPEAMYLLSRAYAHLELVGLEHYAKSLLNENYPNYKPKVRY